MNQYPEQTPDNIETRLSQALNSQPLQTPPHSVWPAIQTALQKKSRARTWLLHWLLPITTGAITASLLFIPLHKPADETQAIPLPDIIRYSQQLETHIKAIEAATPTYDSNTTLAIIELENMIALIDLQLAGPTKKPQSTETLWQKRISLMQDLTQLHSRQLKTVSYNP